MDKVGYIDNEAEQRLKVEFVLEKNRITPKRQKDRENLISAWGINDEILEEFLDLVNENIKDNEEKIGLLTNIKEYRFLEYGEIYDIASFKFGEEVTQGQIESLIDKICDSAIFEYENLVLCPKEKL
ncbi:hypothetical protein [Helicobacter japonicus]|uniref:Uncharacterized protein n=2 Tax=Helicobacter japonicus TaxID=425400 RepID=A0A4U8TQ47_9HELI|nr:hypothetical protein [Helicobacter japonicus]TLE01965.1 hypothetical protein LS65_005235 [Helicobacter japonicus]